MGVKERIRAWIRPRNVNGSVPVVPTRVEVEPEPVGYEMLLAGKTALVTGGGRNIGRSIALEMAAQGATVLFTDVDAGRCRAVEAELRAVRSGAQGFVSDVSRAEDNEALLAAVRGRGTWLDILVNNVGMDAGDFEMTYRTNVFGPMRLTTACADMMIAGGVAGSIIFITSIHQKTVRRVAAYSSSKAALAMVIKELALELAPHRIRVNGIAPGFVQEDEQGGAVPHTDTPLEQSSIPPRYIGRAAVYLAADYFSRFTTGTILKVDAGLSLVNYFGARR
jgi:NAD(P)-dependent dehydrogenase (short-subunit alcohol dehydrogenase family)